MIASVVYWMFRRLAELLVLRRRSDDGKEVEILVLRHGAGGASAAARPASLHARRPGRACALARVLPRGRWGSLFLWPETIRRWHRELVARRQTYRSSTTGRPPTRAAVRDVVLRLARENPTWGYRRILGELARLEIPLAASTVRAILKHAGIEPAPLLAATWQAHRRSALRRDRLGEPEPHWTATGFDIIDFGLELDLDDDTTWTITGFAGDRSNIIGSRE